jgi:hypothetical protein
MSVRVNSPNVRYEADRITTSYVYNTTSVSKDVHGNITVVPVAQPVRCFSAGQANDVAWHCGCLH